MPLLASQSDYDHSLLLEYPPTSIGYGHLTQCKVFFLLPVQCPSIELFPPIIILPFQFDKDLSPFTPPTVLAFRPLLLVPGISLLNFYVLPLFPYHL